MSSSRKEKIKEFLGYKILIERHVSTVIEKQFSKFSLTKQQIQVLHMLSKHKNITTADLGKYLNVTTGAISQLVENLIEQKFIERIESKTDRRVVYFRLLKKGETTFKKIRDGNIKKLSYLFDTLTDKDIDNLTKIFGKMSQEIHKKLDLKN